MHASQMSGTAERALPDPLLPQLCPRLPRDRLVAVGAGRPAQIRDREPRHAVASCSRVMQSRSAVPARAPPRTRATPGSDESTGSSCETTSLLLRLLRSPSAIQDGRGAPLLPFRCKSRLDEGPA